MDYIKMLDYVTDYLTNSPYNKPKNPLYSFRNRASHTKRVFEWGKLIMPDFKKIDEEVALTSCIFHDIGYAKGYGDEHALNSALIFEEYALKEGFNIDFINKVSSIIKRHSDKSLLKDPNTEPELILLLESDLLDEEGALGIVWDLLAFGATNPESYYSTLDVLRSHSGHIINQDYMVTPIAKAYWEDKKNVVIKFIEEIKVDLFLEE